MIDRSALLRHPALEVPYVFGPRDTMLYALATGMGTDPLDATQLRYVYDDPAQPLLVLPTLPIVLGWVDLVRDPRTRDPRLGIDPDRVVVGQAVIALDRPPGTSGRGVTRTYFLEAIDKGEARGALVCVRREVMDDHGDRIATVDTWLFVRGAGGFDGPREGAPRKESAPAHAPDGVIEQPTPGNLALLYRLMLGDHNAAHADPAHARRTGFERPLLHGLATFSIGIHGAVQAGTGDLIRNLPRVKTASATLTRPVFPGDLLRTEVWREGDDLRFRTSVPQRDAVVVEGGRLTLSFMS